MGKSRYLEDVNAYIESIKVHFGEIFSDKVNFRPEKLALLIQLS
jgi:hypothetical protein